MAKIIGKPLPNIPWQDPPATLRTPLWRYDGNPIIGRDGNKRSNSVFNSAVVPFGDGFAFSKRLSPRRGDFFVGV